MRQTGVMDSFDVFANVILCTPGTADRIYGHLDADVDLARAWPLELADCSTVRD